MKLSIVKSVTLASLAVILIGISSTAAASVEVKLVEPKKFRDIDISGLNKSRSIEIVQKDLTRLFNQASKGIVSEGETLLIQVTNVDLAGYIDYFVGSSADHIRIVKDHEHYKLEFSYQLKDSNGTIREEGKKKIKEFISRTPSWAKSSGIKTVGYMHKEVKNWMEQALASK